MGVSEEDKGILENNVAGRAWALCLLGLMTLLAACSSGSSGASDPDWPALFNGRYKPRGADAATIEDTVTGWVWQRCLAGQTWNRTTNRCEGEPGRYTWEEARALTAADGFALPGKDQLQTLIYCSSGQPVELGPTDRYCEGDYQKPTIVAEAFPNTPEFTFWTLTETGENTAWTVNFYRGASSGHDAKASRYHVRLVK